MNHLNNLIRVVVDLEPPVGELSCNHICRYGTALTLPDCVTYHRYCHTREGYAWHVALIRQAVVILRAQWIVEFCRRPRLGQ